MTGPRGRIRHIALAVATVGLLALPWDAGWAAPQSQRWITYSNEAANLAFDYPSAVFTVEQGDPTEALSERTSNKAGRVFTTADGTAVLQFGTFPNVDNLSADDLRKRAATASYADANIEYSRATETWYVLSGTRGGDTFYERVQFSCRGRRLDVFALTYPSAQSKLYDEIVEEMGRRTRNTLSRASCPAT